jgi:hypothetical protein
MALFPPSRLPSWAQNWAQNCEQSWAPRCQLYLLSSDVQLQCLSGSRLVGPLYVWLQGPCDFRHVRGKCSRPGSRAAAFSISTELLAQVFNCRRFNPPPPSASAKIHQSHCFVHHPLYKWLLESRLWHYKRNFSASANQQVNKVNSLVQSTSDSHWHSIY